jgi:hypothetical protein
MMNLPLMTNVDASLTPATLTTVSTAGAKTSSGTTRESAKNFAEKPAEPPYLGGDCWRTR